MPAILQNLNINLTQEAPKNLDDDNLLLKLQTLVGDEKKITGLILEYLAEVESRRLYALRGYPSLFEFCVKELGYSESSAHRRISSMRLIKVMPEARQKLEKGSANLSTLSQLQSFIKREEKVSPQKLSVSSKQELLAAIENKSQSECEREFARISPEIVKIQESQKALTENLTSIKFIASKELLNKLSKLRELLGNKRSAVPVCPGSHHEICLGERWWQVPVSRCAYSKNL